MVKAAIELCQYNHDVTATDCLESTSISALYPLGDDDKMKPIFRSSNTSAIIRDFPVGFVFFVILY
jgi:hypothetical protein